MKILFLNTQSFKTANGLKEICENYQVDILCMNETFESEKNHVTFGDWKTFSSPRPNKARGGAAICLKPSTDFIGHRSSNKEINSIEMVTLEIKDCNKRSFNLWVPYVPPDRPELMKELCNHIEKNNMDNLILVGDFNAKSYEWNNKSENRHGELLEQCMSNSNLICVNDGQATRRESKSIIDLFLVSRNIYNNVRTCETLSHEKVKSDHIAVLLDVTFGKSQTEMNLENEEGWCIRKCNWGKWMEETEETFKHLIIDSKDSIEENYEKVENAMQHCMNICIPRVKRGKRSFHHHPPWWDEKVKEVKHNLNKSQRNFKLRSTPNNYQELVSVEEQFEIVKTEAQIEWSENLCDKIGEAKSLKEKWSAFKKLSKKKTENIIVPLEDITKGILFEESEKSKKLESTFFGGQHLESEKFEEEFYDEIMKEYITICTETSNQEIESQRYNEYITMDELEGSILKLKKETAPGPDHFYTELFIKSGTELRRKLLEIFNQSWESGILPMNWRRANVKFLKKPNKANYNQASSYRPISLTSVVAKIMERIITYRLEGFAETFNIIDPEQEGFRHFRSTTNALMSITQDIFNGFNKSQSTAAVFIDFEKAYDSVWREGLMVKLFRNGIKGEMWIWINAFLSHREARCIVNTHTGNWYQTHIGLPQGSVISPILFNIFIKDMFSKVSADKCKFADDATIWHTNSDKKIIEENLQEDMNKILKWSRQWRMKISRDKTEFCVFSREKQDKETIKLRIDNQQLKYNKNPKVLGMILDEQLIFNEHLEYITKRAKRSLGIIREIKGIGKIPTKSLLQIYDSMVCSIFNYASSIWQIGKTNSLDKINEIQRKGLAMCLDLPTQSSMETLEVISGTLPVDLRREEMAIRQLGKINSYNNIVPIKRKLEEWKEIETPETHISPLGKMYQQAVDMKKTENIDIESIEPQYEFQGLINTVHRPDYWRNLGSSKTRTKHQEEEGRRIINDQLNLQSVNSAIAFTDGSCMGNPGPCGSGAIIYNNDEEIKLKRAISNRGSILLAELMAIKIVLDHVIGTRNSNLDNITIFSDSQTAIGILTLNWKSENYFQAINEIKKQIKYLKDQGITTNIIWTPGHAEVNGNEIADNLAKEAAKEAETIVIDNQTITKQDVKKAARESVTKKWQTRWENSNSGRHYFRFHKTVKDKVKKDLPNKQMYNIMNSLRSGYSKLNSYQKHINQHINTENCEFCNQKEDVEHFLLHCKNYEMIREELIQKLYFIKGNLQVDLDILLEVNSEDSENIIPVLCEYIEATGRF